MRGATLIGQQQKINRLPVRKSVCFNEYHFALADPNRSYIAYQVILFIFSKVTHKLHPFVFCKIG